MIGVGCRGSTKHKVRVLAKYEDNDMDSAVAMAESLADHNKGEYLVFLIDGGSYRILRKVKKTTRFGIPTLKHPFRLFPRQGIKSK